jgi:hypothetical protein
MTKAADIHVYDREDDEFPHKAADDPHWQESVVLLYYDEQAGIGGFHRIGHEAHGYDGSGKQVSWAGIANGDGVRFARTLKHAVQIGDLSDRTFKCTDAYVADFSDGIRWRADDNVFKMDLVAEDYSPRVSPFPHAGETVSDEYAAQHWESGASVKGVVELDGKKYEIDGLGYRDHSWGRRNWTSLASHRWVAGTVGPELTFGAASWQAMDGTLASFAYVARDGVAEHAMSVDILAFMEADATTNRGGVVKMTLHNGEEIVITAKPAIPGFMSENNTIFCVDQICTVEYGGKIGFCDFETTTNPRCGQGPVVSVINGSDRQGLTTDDFFKSLKP